MGGFKIFCQNDMLHSNVNMDVSPNIWRRNTFRIFFFFGDVNSKASSGFHAKFYEKPFSFNDKDLDFVLNCRNMVPDVPQIYASHEFMAK